MIISTILCTYNRCDSLRHALESLAVSEFPESAQWEVLVVDNNSKDQTRSVVEEFSRRYPGHFRYLFEPKQGKSYALNAGIRAATGDVLAFTDDDAIVDPEWMRNLGAVMNDKVWAGSGGRTLPEQTLSLPDWLPAELIHWGGIVGGLFDIGANPCELTEPPYGVNFAFRKEMFEKYGGFREDLGPRPGSEIRNEDTEFGKRIMDAGERICYVPSALVYHEVSENRLRKEYFLKWWFDFGRARIREKGARTKVLGIPRQYFSIPNHLVRILPPQMFRW